MDNSKTENIIVPELYFLISKFLTAGPLQETAKVLVRELEDKKVLPRRTDWLGNEHEQTFGELERKYAHIGNDHLLEVCARLGPIIDKELTPSVPGIVSLLGAGRQSLLRTKESVYRPRTLLDYCTRRHGVSLPDSAVTKPIHNYQKVLTGREYGGPMRRKLLFPTNLYGKTKLLRRTVGHLSSVYCVLFDRTGDFIITGADDLLIKIWSAKDGRLLSTLRGASAEITDIAINLDNTMLAAGSIDRILRVWDMQTTAPVAVLTGHTGMITSVNFCPSPRSDLKYLVTTSTDGSIAFWQYSKPPQGRTQFAPKPTQYHEKLRPGQAQMMCTTFSPGGIFLAAGSADHHVRVYLMSDDGPKRILESEAYTDAVDSVQWSHRGLRFISGSKDGTAHIWTFESQQWKSVKLSMTERLPSCPEPEEGKKLKVTMVAWDCSDKYVITAVNDFTIKIWHSKTAKLHCVLRGHKDELYVLESNPKDEHVLLSAGHDGQVFLWDIDQGVSVAHFINDIDGQGHGGVFDAKWSPDGTMIAATDSHGHILIFGLGISPEKYKLLPNELFFHTDFRPLLRDASHHVVDEQTQVMPHLMPPPFLVDADGNPHPIKYQHFVPGRENCTEAQLVPNLSLGIEGQFIDDLPAEMPPGGAGVPLNYNYAHIDRMISSLSNRPNRSIVGGGVGGAAGNGPSQLDLMIEALANRRGQSDQAPDSNNRPSRRTGGSAASGAGADGNILGGQRAAARRSISESGSNTTRQGATWRRPTEHNQQQQEQQSPFQRDQANLQYVRRSYVRHMDAVQLHHLKQVVYAIGQSEMQEYKREMRRRPIMINTASAIGHNSQSGIGRPRNTRTNGTARVGRRRGPHAGRGGGGSGSQQPAYRTRAVRDQEVLDEPVAAADIEEEDDEDSSASSGDTSYSNVEENLDESSDDSDTESSDYSDWVADTPGPNLEPPKRSKRKPLSRRRTFTDDSSDEERAANADQPSGSGTVGASNTKGRRRNKHVLIPPPAPNGEIPELYRPAEWLSEVIPRKAPYYPQMGDEVVYFRQGHQRYLDAVRSKKVYKLTHSSEPWHNRQLRAHEFVRVIGIKYEIRPPRLCCLKLAMVNRDGNMSGDATFKIKYHDMPDVLDFLVLRQTFDLAVQRNWSIGDRFRCMIGDGWWMGQIESRHSLSAEFPQSFFMCFRVRWDNGEYEYMSPWDMEPIDEVRLPEEIGGAVSVLPEEIRATLYQPKSEEWHRGDRDGSCRRIISGLEQVMRLSIAEHFLAPVDLNIYPDYAYLIEYPIDLTTVKSRFENHFYRRITSAQFDVRYLATNAEKYNRSHTNIVKHARIITDLCLRIIREPNDIDVAAVYHQLVDVYHSSDSEQDNESDVVPSTSTGPTTSAVAARQRVSSTRRSNRIRSDGDWRSDCRQLLDMMWQRPDSLPFREPVDTIEFPDYLEIIATPMDLRTVKEDLLGGNYDDPLDFAKDVRLIFQNSKNYNTNKRSRIYSMTLRLSALFESHMKKVVSNWKAARRRASKQNKSSSGRGSTSSPTKRTPPERNRNGGGGGGSGGIASRRKAKPTATRGLRSSEDDDEDDDDDDSHHEVTLDVENGERSRGGGTQRNCRRNVVVGAVASTSSSNRVTSSSSHRQRHNDNVVTTVPRRGRSQHATSEDATSTHTDSEDDEDDEDTSDQATTDAASDVGEEDDDGEHSEDNGRQRRRGRRAIGSAVRRKKPHESDDDDSEESYNPQRRGANAFGAAKRRKLNKKSKRNKSTKRKRHAQQDDDEEDYHDGARKRRSAQTSATTTNGTRSARGVQRRRLARSSEDDRHNAGNSANASQHDESTQDTVSHTPKKKGRPPKAQSTTKMTTTAATTTSSTSINGLYSSGASAPAIGSLLQESPSRNTRNQGASVSRRPQNAAENDHSYHLPVRNGRIAESDTDSRELVTARPTRQSVKRAILDWARGSDIEDEPDESEDAEEILPTPTKNDDRPSTSRAAIAAIAANSGSVGGSGVMRQLRTNRNTVVEANDDESDDDEDDSDNEPLAGSQQKTVLKTSTPHPMSLQRRLPHAVALSSARITPPSHMTRSHATSTTSNIATSTTAPSNRSSGAVDVANIPAIATHDHNYMGAGAPSTSRHLSRRGLSRHQRNADELDSSLDPLENSRLLLGGPNQYRRPTSTSSAATTSIPPVAVNSTNIQVRRGRSRYSQEPSQTEDANGDDEDVAGEDDDEGAASDQGTDGGSSTPDSEEEGAAAAAVASDSEDDQPLTSYVPTSRNTTERHRRPPLRNQKQSTTTQSSRSGRRSATTAHSDDSYVCNDDDDDDYNVRQTSAKSRSRHRRRKHASGETSSARSNRSRRNQRGSARNQKRPRYNEQSDDEEHMSRSKRVRPASDTYPATNTASTSRDRPQQQHHHHDDTGDGGTTDESDDHMVSVSSRGRVRKITAKARGIFKE